MYRRQSSAVDKALRLIGKPKSGGGVWTRYAVAKHYGLALSTVYRAVKRQPGEVK